VQPSNWRPRYEGAGKVWFEPPVETGLPSLVMLSGPETGPPNPVDLLRPLVEHLVRSTTTFENVELIEDLVDEANEALDPLRERLTNVATRYVPSLSSVELRTPTLTREGEEQAIDLLLDLFTRDLALALYRSNEYEETLDEVGAGTRRALALSVLELYSDPGLSDDSARGSTPLIVVEEPEVGLHAGAQQRVAESLKALAATGVQTIVVTHSPTIVDAADRSGLRIVRQRSDGFREVVEPVDLAEIVETVGASPADILLADRFLIVEGKSDAAILTMWARKRGWDLREHRVQIFAAGSWTKASGIAAFAEVAYAGARFFVVLDGGSQTTEEAENIRGRLGDRVDVTVLRQTQIERYFPLRAVAAWVASQSENDVDQWQDALASIEMSKRALREIASEYLGRDYFEERDGVAIASLMREGEVPNEFVDIFMKATTR